MNLNSNIFEWLKRNWALILAIVVGILASSVAIQYAMQPLLEQHGFRQTQTALTSYWMMEDGWRLAYETPVGGYPWTIPFEFPIYQAIVAFLSSLFNSPLSATGRIVSFIFLLACAWPAYMITQRLSLKKEVAWVFCALLWSSPLYFFWGRTFMIETTAVFFAMAAIAYAIDLIDKEPSLKSIIFFCVFASLGMLQKVTTVAPVLLIMSFVILIGHLKKVGFKLPSTRKFILVLIAFLIPFSLAFIWTNYTDQIKSQSTFGATLTSEALSKWNYGTMEQRLNLDNLKTVFWDRIMVNNTAAFYGIAILIFALLFAKKSIRRYLLICLLLFVLPVLIFMNLHLIHTYYQVSSTFFLIAAIAIGLADVLPQKIKKIPLAPFIILFMIGHNIYSYQNTYEKYTLKKFDLSNSSSLAISDIIERYTDKNSGVVIFGANWNSEIAYYSKRKSFTVPDWFKSYDSVWKAPANYIGDLDLAAVVFIQKDSNITAIKERPDVQKDSCLYKIYENCYIWLPGVKAISAPQGVEQKADLFTNVYNKK